MAGVDIVDAAQTERMHFQAAFLFNLPKRPAGRIFIPFDVPAQAIVLVGEYPAMRRPFHQEYRIAIKDK